jgi:hypothetical protein
MPGRDKEADSRWGLAIDAIDESLESDDPVERLQAAIAWALTDLADSLDELLESRASASRTPRSAARKSARKAGARKSKRPRVGEDEEE